MSPLQPSDDVPRLSVHRVVLAVGLLLSLPPEPALAGMAVCVSWRGSASAHQDERTHVVDEPGLTGTAADAQARKLHDQARASDPGLGSTPHCFNSGRSQQGYFVILEAKYDNIDTSWDATTVRRIAVGYGASEAEAEAQARDRLEDHTPFVGAEFDQRVSVTSRRSGTFSGAERIASGGGEPAPAAPNDPAPSVSAGAEPATTTPSSGDGSRDSGASGQAEDVAAAAGLFSSAAGATVGAVSSTGGSSDGTSGSLQCETPSFVRDWVEGPQIVTGLFSVYALGTITNFPFFLARAGSSGSRVRDTGLTGPGSAIGPHLSFTSTLGYVGSGYHDDEVDNIINSGAGTEPLLLEMKGAMHGAGNLIAVRSHFVRVDFRYAYQLGKLANGFASGTPSFGLVGEPIPPLLDNQDDYNAAFEKNGWTTTNQHTVFGFGAGGQLLQGPLSPFVTVGARFTTYLDRRTGVIGVQWGEDLPEGREDLTGSCFRSVNEYDPWPEGKKGYWTPTVTVGLNSFFAWNWNTGRSRTAWTVDAAAILPLGGPSLPGVQVGMGGTFSTHK